MSRQRNPSRNSCSLPADRLPPRRGAEPFPTELRRNLVALLPEQLEASFGDGCVIERAAAPLDLRQGHLNAESRPVGPVRTHRLHHVSHRQDARLEEDSLTVEPLRVAATVQPLVVLQHYFGYRPGEFDVLEHIVASLRVGSNQL